MVQKRGRIPAPQERTSVKNLDRLLAIFHDAKQRLIAATGRVDIPIRDIFMIAYGIAQEHIPNPTTRARYRRFILDLAQELGLGNVKITYRTATYLLKHHLMPSDFKLTPAESVGPRFKEPKDRFRPDFRWQRKSKAFIEELKEKYADELEPDAWDEL